MMYFKSPKTLEALRRQYKELLKQYHPDTPEGSTAATQTINAEYEQLFRMLKDKHETDKTSQGNSSAYSNMKYDFTEDEQLRNILRQVIRFEGITIEIIGNWIWLSGNTYQYKKDFKEMGFKFAGQKKMWYWHSDAFQKKSHRSLSINDIRNYYGSTEIATETTQRIATA